MTVKAPYRIVVSIFEENKDFPAVVHIFYGRVPQEAAGYFRAHMRADSFLEACVNRGQFATFACHAERKTERWDGQHWVAA